MSAREWHVDSQHHAQPCFCFFFFNDTATTEIYPLSLHDALPIWLLTPVFAPDTVDRAVRFYLGLLVDRKSTRLNSSHLAISYAVFCLKKKCTKRLCDRASIRPAQNCERQRMIATW